MPREIVTKFDYPPIPVRQFDWIAHYDGEEEAGGYGYGATEQEAIADFVENHQDDHDERLDAWCRAPEHDTRISRGDDFASDGWTDGNGNIKSAAVEYVMFGRRK